MIDKIPTNENTAEKIHNEREVLNLLGEIVGDDFEITNSVEDEEGLRALNIIAIGEDGEKVGYDYRRGDAAGDTVIDVVFYDGDIPCGGHALKKYKEGKWTDEQ